MLNENENENENDKAAPELFTISVMLISGQEYEYTDLSQEVAGIVETHLTTDAKWIRVDQTYWNSDEVQSVTILPQEAE